MFFFLFLNYWLILLIPSVITLSFIVTAEFAIPTRIQTKEAKAEIETHPVTAEAKKVNAQYNLKSFEPFCAFYLLICFALFLK